MASSVNWTRSDERYSIQSRSTVSGGHDTFPQTKTGPISLALFKLYTHFRLTVIYTCIPTGNRSNRHFNSGKTFSQNLFKFGVYIYSFEKVEYFFPSLFLYGWNFQRWGQVRTSMLCCLTELCGFLESMEYM